MTTLDSFDAAAYDGVDLVSAEALAKAGLPVPFAAARRGYAHATWARTFGSRPALFVQPATAGEVVAAVRLARRRRQRIATTGCGHSPSDMTCTSGWLVNLDGLNRVVSVDDGATGLVTVEAGIRLRDLSAALRPHGLALPNLGSINAQSLAGACATGTHGSSLRHGLLSDDVTALAIVLGDGTLKRVSRASEDDDDKELFRAALLSVGALGIVVEMTIRAVPAFRLRWTQTVDTDAAAFAAWRAGTLWTQAHFVRVWWLPYTRRAVVWAADDCEQTAEEAPDDTPATSFCDSALGYFVYHNLLALGRRVPWILPTVEWFVFGLQYGFGTGPGRARVTSGLQAGDAALLMNCLYAQSVNEWALPLARGPEALARLGAWLNRLRPGDAGYVAHGIPFSAEGLYVHAPVEVRVAETSTQDPDGRPLLDPTCPDTATLYLNAIMYRPYHRDVPGIDRYYEAFEWLMRDLGGRPHWAKCFRAGHAELAAAYGDRLRRFCAVRAAADPDGVFVGPWQRRLLLGEGEGAPLPCEEVEQGRTTAPDGSVVVEGRQGLS